MKGRRVVVSLPDRRPFEAGPPVRIQERIDGAPFQPTFRPTFQQGAWVRVPAGGALRQMLDLWIQAPSSGRHGCFPQPAPGRARNRGGAGGGARKDPGVETYPNGDRPLRIAGASTEERNEQRLERAHLTLESACTATWPA